MTKVVGYKLPEVSSVSAIEEVEMSLFIDLVRDYNGYDFSQYQKASLKRRVLALVESQRLNHISELFPKILHDEGFIQTVIEKISVGVTELFRDPYSYSSIRENIFPILHSFPNLKIWHAGCSTGEEVYSLCMLLEEAGLRKKSTIHASDFNASVLEKARGGVLNYELSKDDVKHYLEAGGEASLLDYFTCSNSRSIFNEKSLNTVTFDEHNLVHDGIFCEAHLVMCRNVLIYFNIELQNAVLKLLSNSLCRGGFLVLGSKESLISSPIQKNFKVIDNKARIYQKIN